MSRFCYINNIIERQVKAMFNTLEVLANCFASYRINNNEYIPSTRRFSEDTPTAFANKEMLIYNFYPQQDRSLIPKDFVPFKATDEDRKNAKDAVAYINRDTSLQQIAGTLSEYMKNLVTCINSDSISKNEFGIVAVLPKIYYETKHKKDTKKLLKTEFSESKHIGLPGAVVSGLMQINEIKFVEKFGCHVVNGSIENNLVSFFKNFEAGKELPKQGTTIKIKGKVKRHGENFITKLPETQLNYVKIV